MAEEPADFTLHFSGTANDVRNRILYTITEQQPGLASGDARLLADAVMEAMGFILTEVPSK